MNVPGLPNPWLILAAVAALGIAGGVGYRTGVKSADARHDAVLLAQIEAGQKLDKARLHALAARDDLARKLEESAYADPVISNQCFGPNRVRRLNALR